MRPNRPQVTVGTRTKYKVWIWTALNHFQPGILAWVVGNRSAKTFELLWQVVSLWQCYFYITDGYAVYRSYIQDGAQIVSKIYMTRVVDAKRFAEG